MAEGAENDLLDRLAGDPGFAIVDADALRAEVDPARYIGRAPEQVHDFSEGPLKQLYQTLIEYSAPDDAKVTL